MIRSFLFYAYFCAVSLFGDISAVYLSWYADPCTTMTIHWHSLPEDSALLRLELPNGITPFSATTRLFANEPVVIHTVRVENLSPDTEYAFQLGNENKKYRFRTAPTNLDNPLKFIIGGDLYLSRHLFTKMGQVVVNQDPLFAVLGGDLAYAVNNPSIFADKPPKQWRKFLADWTKTMQTTTGRLIPFILVIGNHDINSKTQELFFSLFDYPGKELYRAVDFGSYLSLLLLDTGHVSAVEGPQTTWLAKALEQRKNVPHLMAVYHVGAYPSFYSYDSRGPKTIRTHWCPLFDKYAVRACFEHHSHAFKKTFPLKADQKAASEGTTYFGDGCWGGKPRKTHNAWYLKKASSQQHVFLAEMTSQSVSISALGIQGQVIDKTDLKSRQISQVFNN